MQTSVSLWRETSSFLHECSCCCSHHAHQVKATPCDSREPCRGQGPLTHARHDKPTSYSTGRHPPCQPKAHTRAAHLQLVFNTIPGRTALANAQHKTHFEFLLHQTQPFLKFLPLILWFTLCLRSWPLHSATSKRRHADSHQGNSRIDSVS